MTILSNNKKASNNSSSVSTQPSSNTSLASQTSSSLSSSTPLPSSSSPSLEQTVQPAGSQSQQICTILTSPVTNTNIIQQVSNVNNLVITSDTSVSSSQLSPTSLDLLGTQSFSNLKRSPSNTTPTIAVSGSNSHTGTVITASSSLSKPSRSETTQSTIAKATNLLGNSEHEISDTSSKSLDVPKPPTVEVTIKRSNENIRETDAINNSIESDQLYINIKSVKSLEKHLSSSSVSSSSSSSSTGSKGSKHSSSHSNATNLNKTKSNRIKKTNNCKRKTKNEYNSALASLNPAIQRGKITNRTNLNKQQHQPHMQTIININNQFNNIDEEHQHRSHQHHHRHLDIISNNNVDDENDTDILDESDSDLEPNLNKISTGNSGISDEDEEAATDSVNLDFNNSNILINQQQNFYYQQQQQQQMFQQYIYNDQENDPLKTVLNSSKNLKQNKHKNVKVNKIKPNRNNNNSAESNVDSARNLKIKIKKNNLKETKFNINSGKDELNNSEDEYDQRPLRESIGLNQIVNSENHHVKHTGNLNKNHESFITAETIEELEAKFCRILKEKKGFIIKPMKEDGACLFRAVADQIYGDEEMNSTIRCHCMDYIAKNADYFKQYMTEDVERYIARKRQDTCFGNYIEIIAIAEIYNRPIEVYEYSTEPKNTFQGVFQTDNEPIRLSYHGRNHYNSVVNPHKATIGVGLGLPQLIPGLAEKSLMNDAIKKSEEFQIEQAMLDDKLKATDWEATNEEIMELVARESYLQWIKDNENRNNSRNTYLNLNQNQAPSSYSNNTNENATCSTWDNNQLNNNIINSPNRKLTRATSRRSSTSTPPPSFSNSMTSSLSSSQSKLSNQSTRPANENNKTKKQPQYFDDLNYFMQQNDKFNNANEMTTNQLDKNTQIALNVDNSEYKNLLRYDEEENMSMQYQYDYDANKFSDPHLYDFSTNDWGTLDDGGSNNDILARVLAASQQEYLESLKAKRQQQQQQGGH